MEKKSEGTVETQETGWTEADLQKLLVGMKDSIPENKKMNSYIIGLKSLDWNKVAFPPFSPEECKQKWTKMQEKMRKIRTLTELIVEAEDVIANPGCNRKGKNCTKDAEDPPPKPPQSGYVLFTKEQLMSMTGTSAKNKLEVCGQRWQELSDKEKEKYRTNCTELKRQYRIKLNAYLERFDIEKQQRILKENGIKTPNKRKREECTEDAEGPPPKPPQTGYNMFCKEQLACMTNTSKTKEFRVCARRWRKLSKTEKEEYRRNCTELNRQYRIKLNEYLARFDIEKQQRILRENGIKTPKQCKMMQDKRMELQPGEPKMPSLSGNVIFCQNQMKLLKNEIPNATQRFVQANRMWQDLSKKQKEHYKRKVDEKMETYSIELQKWFKTLTAEEQEDYLTRKPKKRQYLKTKKKEDFVKKPHLCQPSDSEDDDIEFSEEESCWYYEEDEDEEEEDEKDAMFEM
uniref:Nucleolar transcription factor 1-like n=1 Tax=Acanthochromis polyacanthus TaxID=80966 RepID=A0A3Q1GR77_9TELE